MKIMRNELQSDPHLRSEWDFPKKDIEFIEISPLLMQPDVFQEIIARFADEIADLQPDYIISPEARGFFFGPTLAYELGIGFIPVRKAGKMPSSFVATKAQYEKEYAKDELVLPTLVNEDYSGKKFYIIDDIFATGGTNNVIKNTIESLGGEVVGEGAIIKILGLNNDTEVFTLIDIKETRSKNNNPVRSLAK